MFYHCLVHGLPLCSSAVPGHVPRRALHRAASEGGHAEVPEGPGRDMHSHKAEEQGEEAAILLHVAR